MPVGMLKSTMSLSDIMSSIFTRARSEFPCATMSTFLLGPELRDDSRLPIGQYPRQGVLERFGGGQRARVDVGIARVETRMPRVVLAQRAAGEYRSCGAKS